MKKHRSLLIALVFLLVFLSPAAARSAGQTPLRFGVLPVIQALPVFVAQENGLFKAEGLEVEIVSFRTALEKDVALSTGRLDGYFGDLFTPIVLRAGGTDLRIAARNYKTGDGNRMFGIVTGPKSDIRSLAELADVPVALSSNTIIDYITRELLSSAGVPADRIKTVEVRNIPIRYQMLLGGQVQAATIPEPLVTLSLEQGCRLLGDDASTGLSSTVLVFTSQAITDRPDDLVRFFTAVNNAVEIINSGLDSVRGIMNRNCNVPKPLQDSYPVPRFPRLAPPDEADVTRAAAWLKDNGVVKTSLSYSDLVDTDALNKADKPAN